MAEKIDILSSKYFIDGLEKEESEELTELLKKPEYKERFEWFRNNWENDQADTGCKFDMNSGKDLTAEMIRKAEPGFEFKGPELSKSTSLITVKRNSRLWIGIAASIAIIIASAIIVNTLKKPAGESVSALQYSEISTELGQLSDVSLPDGSKVFLNSSSRFIRPAEFSGNDRIVQLSGEAYFEIAPDPERPFIIHSNLILTQVLGTKFNVKAYSEEDIISVSVVEGIVRISRKNTNPEAWIEIGAGQEYVLDQSTQTEEVRAFSKDKVLGWREGKFVFESSPLKRVLPILSRKFDVEFVLENENLNQCQLTAVFDNENLETILDVISFAYDIDYDFSGRKIILKGPGCLK
jgi:ferric-dicitrate binding protein FerR (iron transport regulator)